MFPHHGRKRDSPQALETLAGYDAGRRAHYASLMLSGHGQAWHLWAETTQDQPAQGPSSMRALAREMADAQRYLEHLAKATTT